VTENGLAALTHHDSFVKNRNYGAQVWGVLYLSPGELKKVCSITGPLYAWRYSSDFARDLANTTAPGVVYSSINAFLGKLPRSLRKKATSILESIKGYHEGEQTYEYTTRVYVAAMVLQQAKKYAHWASQGHGLALAYERNRGHVRWSVDKT
jgi:hypothetical protein